MALQFPPRGGSAQVVRYLGPEIAAAGWSVSLVAGSVGEPGELGYAPEFFAPLPVTPVDYTPAMQDWASGGDPLAGPRPLHPSFEDRAGAPDRVFAALDDAAFERQVACWSTALVAGGLRAAGVAHLHHLTPINEAVARLRPDLPVVVSLHGTEMNMLEAIARHDEATASWAHREAWSGRLRAWAARADRLVVDSPADVTRALGLFDVPADRLVVVAPGVDHNRFRPQHRTVAERLEVLHRLLVDDPRGWDESGVVGSVRYTPQDLAAFTDPDVPVLIFVGRFTHQKRLPLLLRAYARARREHGLRAPLLVWGGFPGEWEGAASCRWLCQGHIPGCSSRAGAVTTSLPTGLGCADVFVSPSVGEAFGQVFIEAMACGLPVAAAASGGPLSFVNDDPDAPNGWLVTPDDEAALAAALAQATTGPTAPTERARRATNALAQVRARFTWQGAAHHVAGLYDQVSDPRTPLTR